MRIASHSAAQALGRAVAERKAELHEQQIQISSGRKYQLRSEATVDAARAAQLHQTESISSQFLRGVQRGGEWSTVTESKLDAILGLANRSREISLTAGDATMDDQARKGLALELDGILEDLVGYANTKHNGAALFGGTRANTDPVQVTRNAEGQINGISYTADTDTPRSVQVDETTVVEYGIPATGSQGLFADSATGRDLLTTIMTIRDDVGAGNSVPDFTLEKLEKAFDGVTQALVGTGLQQSRFQSLEKRYQEEAVQTNQQLSDVEDVDLAESIGRLSELEASLEASMRMAANVGQLSLSKFI